MVYLNISFEQKDKAKKAAQAGGTRIKWDGAKKTWYWEGDKLPECLEQYSWKSTSKNYAKYQRDFNSFLESPAGKKWERQQEQIVASELHYSTPDVMKSDEERYEQEKADWELSLSNYHRDVVEHYEMIKAVLPKISQLIFHSHGMGSVAGGMTIILSPHDKHICKTIVKALKQLKSKEWLKIDWNNDCGVSTIILDIAAKETKMFNEFNFIPNYDDWD